MTVKQSIPAQHAEPAYFSATDYLAATIETMNRAANATNAASRQIAGRKRMPKATREADRKSIHARLRNRWNPHERPEFVYCWRND